MSVKDLWDAAVQRHQEERRKFFAEREACYHAGHHLQVSLIALFDETPLSFLRPRCAREDSTFHEIAVRMEPHIDPVGKIEFYGLGERMVLCPSDRGQYFSAACADTTEQLIYALIDTFSRYRGK
jgi:hypothetical protein